MQTGKHSQQPAKTPGSPVRFHDFWYVAAESHELKASKPLQRKILDEWIVLFRDKQGRPVALQDRCLHRSAQLSKGSVKNGCIQCPYHGWTYNEAGQVTHIPSEGKDSPRIGKKFATRFHTAEQQGYIYICLGDPDQIAQGPFAIPYYREQGYQSIRLQHRFENNVTNCVENFIDIPHTLSVHPGIFRAKSDQKISATIQRKDGSVKVSYKNETTNLGFFAKFLNPGGREIEHTDSFHMPNVTCVEYFMSKNRHFIITSQSIPLNDRETLVYTDLNYNYGIWNKLAIPLVWIQAKIIIYQDIKILKNQMKTIDKYGDRFNNSPADIIHVMIESVREAIAKGKDPRTLSEKTHNIHFWI